MVQVWKVAQHVPSSQGDAFAQTKDALKKAKRRYWVSAVGHVILFVLLLCIAMAGYILLGIDEAKWDKWYFMLYLTSLSLPLWVVVMKVITLTDFA